MKQSSSCETDSHSAGVKKMSNSETLSVTFYVARFLGCTKSNNILPQKHYTYGCSTDTVSFGGRVWRERGELSMAEQPQAVNSRK
jgi:hypothetical protein